MSDGGVDESRRDETRTSRSRRRADVRLESLVDVVVRILGMGNGGNNNTIGQLCDGCVGVGRRRKSHHCEVGHDNDDLNSCHMPLRHCYGPRPRLRRLYLPPTEHTQAR